MGKKLARIGSAILYRVIVDFRYKPTLRAYQAMDYVGIALAEDFPNWERGPLALEIQNRKMHRRLSVTFREAVFECIGVSDEEKEFDLVRKSVSTVATKMQFSGFERYAVRCWFIAEARVDQEQLVDLVYSRFCTPVDRVGAFSGYHVKDAAYAVDLARDEWTYGVRLGPMTKEEFLSRVPHDRKIFEADLDGETLEKHAGTLPDRLIYMDIDIWRETVLEEETRRHTRRLRTRAREIANGIVDHLRS